MSHRMTPWEREQEREAERNFAYYDDAPAPGPRIEAHVHDYDEQTGSCFCGDIWDESKLAGEASVSE